MNVTTLLATERPMSAGSFALQARTASRPVGYPVAGPVVDPAGLPASLAPVGSVLEPSFLNIVDHGYPCAIGAEVQAEVDADGSRGFGRRFTSWCTSAATRVANQFANLTANAAAELKQAFAGEAAEVTVT